MLEKVIEAHLVKRVKEAGGVAYKFTSPQRRSVPDRLVLGDKQAAGKALFAFLDKLAFAERRHNTVSAAEYEVAAAKIVAEMIHFVETKATGAKPTPMQEREHARLRERGFVVKVIDSKEQIDKEYGK